MAVAHTDSLTTFKGCEFALKIVVNMLNGLVDKADNLVGSL